MRIFLKLLLIPGVIFFCYHYSYCQENTSIEGVYEIDEINIKFENSYAFEESAIISLLSSKTGDVFDMNTYLLDVERIKKFYFDNGFFNARIDTNLQVIREDKEVIENFIVKENERFSYYNIEYKGLDSIDASVKSLIFNHKRALIVKGKYYSKDTVNLELLRIMEILFNNGYATATSGFPEILKYETNKENLLNKVDVVINFDPKRKYDFGKTLIKFTNYKYNVTEEDIRRELTYKQDQVYDKSKIIESELKLSKFSILENPRINIDTINSVTGKVDLIINAVVGKKYDITPEVFGYYFQNYFYIGTGLSFSDRNFLGGGRVLTTSARVYFNSLENNRFDIVNSVYQPFLFGNRFITGNWNIGYEYVLEKSINIGRLKNSFGVTYELPKHTYINSLQGRWDLENSRIVVDNDIPIEGSELVIGKFDYNEFISKLGFTAIHNSVNSIIFPSGGNYQSYEFEESGLLSGIIRRIFNTSTFSYFKFTNLSSAYINTSNREVNVPSALAFKFLAGIIIEYGQNTFTFLGQEYSEDRVPRDTRYFGGGSSSIRGWGAKQLGIVPNKELGGNFTFENTVEYRIKPFMTAENLYLRDLGFATFIDYGNVWSEIGKFKLNEIALASGAGIRYYTIIGAIRFDVGFKIYDPQPGPVGGSNWIFGKGSNFSDKYNFQFGIGNTF